MGGHATAAQQADDTSTKVSLYYSSENSSAHGKLVETLDYSTLRDFNPASPQSGRVVDFAWADFQNLPVGDYYVYAVIEDGQSAPQYSAIAGPFTAVSPYSANVSFTLSTPS